MPELPEVETTVRKLRPLIKGKRILGLNRKIISLERKGKAVLINLSGNYILAFHQRMSGRLLVVPHDYKDKYIRRRFRLSDGKDLAFHDVRRFGVVWYGPAEKVLNDNYFKTLGEDALSISFGELKKILKTKSNPLNPPYSKGDTKKRNISYNAPLKVRGAEGGYERRGGAIKPFLLNQKNLAGIGNIMADEILWKAKTHPERKIFSLTNKETKILWNSLRAVLKKSIRLGGSTMRDWFHPDGDSGGYFEKRMVYDREGKKCFRCRSEIVRKKIAGRSSYYCGKCQII